MKYMQYSIFKFVKNRHAGRSRTRLQMFMNEYGDGEIRLKMKCQFR